MNRTNSCSAEQTVAADLSERLMPAPCWAVKIAYCGGYGPLMCREEVH